MRLAEPCRSVRHVGYRISGLAAHIDLGALRHEVIHHVVIAQVAGAVECGISTIVDCINVDTELHAILDCVNQRQGRVDAPIRGPADSRRGMQRRVAGLGSQLGIGAMLDQSAATLTVAGRKRLELARALAIEPKLLLLDEVLAGLNPSEVRDMVPVIQAIRARGITIVLIEHVMQAVMSLAEQVFVLTEGRIIAMGPPEAIAADSRVIEAYLGHGAATHMRGAAHG